MCLVSRLSLGSLDAVVYISMGWGWVPAWGSGCFGPLAWWSLGPRARASGALRVQVGWSGGWGVAAWATRPLCLRAVGLYAKVAARWWQ